jgi:hypothetical protein
VIVSPPLLDPFEHELTLADEPRVLSFSPKSFDIALPDLVRTWAFDLVGAIPYSLGSVREEFHHGSSQIAFESSFFRVGNSVLALCTAIRQGASTHRVLELLGISEDIRVRFNQTLVDPERAGELDLSEAAAEIVAQGRPLGQVRVWGSESSPREEIRSTLARTMRNLGLDSQIHDRSVEELTYRPPTSSRLNLDALPHNDLRVADLLLALLDSLPVADAPRRAPKRVSCHQDRIRREGSIASFRYETHRAATGVIHMRRREVEAGLERPGLVRTFNVAGLAGAARLRIRDVGGRVSAEFAGTVESVEHIRAALIRDMGGRTG